MEMTYNSSTRSETAEEHREVAARKKIPRKLDHASEPCSYVKARDLTATVSEL